ncbi:unnamed protein product [Effrenium voratum]|nr:unnamed protein product [Effrenium voratum]
MAVFAVRHVWQSCPSQEGAPASKAARPMHLILVAGLAGLALLRPETARSLQAGVLPPSLQVPKSYPKRKVPQTISEGRRLVKIGELIDVAEEMKEMKFEEARSGGAEIREKGKRHRQKLRKWSQRGPQEAEGTYGRITESGGFIASWLPNVFMDNGHLGSCRIWKEPLVSDDLAILFDTFGPDLQTELMPVVVYALQKAFVTTSLPQITIILEAMAIARHSYEEAYQVMGEQGALHCQEGSDDEVVEFGFALALAAQRVPKQCYLRLKEGLEMHLGSLGGERVRLLSWACWEAGAKLPDLLGLPPKEVPTELAEHVWSSCSTLAAEKSNRLVNGWPLPLVEAQVFEAKISCSR